jgi:CheY-like chemotaxis protein
MMPILDGAEMLRAMQATELQRDIPCIVMSSISGATVQERIRNYASFVRKPFQLAAMIELVATIFAAPRPER